MGFRGLQQRSLDQQRSLASASAPTSLFGLGSAGALRPISSAGAVHAGSAAYLSLGASSGQEAELVTRLARLKGELHAARQQHAVAMQEARQGAEQLRPRGCRHGGDVVGRRRFVREHEAHAHG